MAELQRKQPCLRRRKGGPSGIGSEDCSQLQEEQISSRIKKWSSRREDGDVGNVADGDEAQGE